ncbi:MAG: hypothetical protein V4655_03920 [Bdellovibrionota bacterium]|nr:MAG: hypothetical protein EOP10_15600 [Pseudomonadota bacterium]
MRILKPKKQSESGVSVLIIFVAIVGFMIAMRYVTTNMITAGKKGKVVEDAIGAANAMRFVQQMIADDQLCKMTDFLDGIKGWEIKKLTQDKILKDNGRLVDYSKIGVNDLKWPVNTFEGTRSYRFPDGHTEVGKVKVDSVVFIQPKDKDPLQTIAHGKTYYRIPVSVREKGTFNGQTVIFPDGVDTYIELDPLDPLNKAVACYKSVSPRSLCLDAGGDFDPSALDNKCLMPGQAPSERRGGAWSPGEPGGIVPSRGTDRGNIR